MPNATLVISESFRFRVYTFFCFCSSFLFFSPFLRFDSLLVSTTAPQGEGLFSPDAIVGAKFPDDGVVCGLGVEVPVKKEGVLTRPP